MNWVASYTHYTYVNIKINSHFTKIPIKSIPPQQDPIKIHPLCTPTFKSKLHQPFRKIFT